VTDFYLFRLRMLSAWGDLMYCSTICFQRLRQSQPLKKLCTFLIFRSSSVSWQLVAVDAPEPPALAWEFRPLVRLALVLYEGTGRHSFFRAHSWNIKQPWAVSRHSCRVFSHRKKKESSQEVRHAVKLLGSYWQFDVTFRITECLCSKFWLILYYIPAAIK
jgi:hypothetical protein